MILRRILCASQNLKLKGNTEDMFGDNVPKLFHSLHEKSFFNMIHHNAAFPAFLKHCFYCSGAYRMATLSILINKVRKLEFFN